VVKIGGTMPNSEEIKAEVGQLAARLGHEGFIYLYYQDGRIKLVGDMSVSVLAPLLMDIIKRKVS